MTQAAAKKPLIVMAAWGAVAGGVTALVLSLAMDGKVHPSGPDGASAADSARAAGGGISEASTRSRPGEGVRQRRVYHSSLLDQANEIDRFIKLYAKDPGGLRYLLEDLKIPDPLKSRVADAAVAEIAKSNPKGALEGILSIPDKTSRDRLVSQAVACWKEVDPKNAYEWAEANGGNYPGAILQTSAAFWKQNPGEALARLQSLGPKEKNEFIAGVTAFKIPLSLEQEKAILGEVRGLAATGDFSAGSLESQMVRILAAKDPDYVDDYLYKRGSTQLIESVTPDLALAHGKGDWKAANQWLSNYNGEGPVTAGAAQFWTKWAASDDSSLIDYMQSSLESEGTRKMMDFLRDNVPRNERGQKLRGWIESHSKKE